MSQTSRISNFDDAHTIIRVFLAITHTEASLQGWHNNKDHQRMMVDPMFMIVQSLRSFLTAVTPTAVAPIAVILPDFT